MTARPDWLTDEMLAEMRRLKGTSEHWLRPKTEAYYALVKAEVTSCKVLDPTGEEFVANSCGGDCWLTIAGHVALGEIEKEMQGDWVVRNGSDGDAQWLVIDYDGGEIAPGITAVPGRYAVRGDPTRHFSLDSLSSVPSGQPKMRCACGNEQLEDEARHGSGQYEGSDEAGWKYICGVCWEKESYSTEQKPIRANHVSVGPGPTPCTNCDHGNGPSGLTMFGLRCSVCNGEGVG